MRLYPSVKWACTELTYDREEVEAEAEGVNVEEDEAAATLKALQEYSSSKRDRKNKPQYKMFMKLFRCRFLKFSRSPFECPQGTSLESTRNKRRLQ